MSDRLWHSPELTHSHNLSLAMDGVSLPFDKFLKAQVLFSDILKELNKEAFRGESRGVQWVVSTVKKSSPYQCVLEGIAVGKDSGSEDVSEIIKIFESGFETLEKGSDYPAYFNEKSLEYVQSLGQLISDRDISDIRFSQNGWRVAMTKALAANAHELIKPKYQSYGSFEGKLTAINLYQRPNFRIRNLINPQESIICFFPDSMLGEAKDYLGKRVYVYGLIRQREDGKKLNIHVEELERLPEKGELPTLQELFDAINS
jgi:hypothetical protein